LQEAHHRFDFLLTLSGIGPDVDHCGTHLSLQKRRRIQT
jgi:hypothetical protein